MKAVDQVNKAQKEVLQAQLNSEKKTIKLLQRVYDQARKDCEKKIRELSSRTDLENLQSIIYQKQYQEALKKQLDGILDNLQSEEFTSIADYLQKCYHNGYIGVMYDLHQQGIPIIMPINQEQVVKALQVDSKISKGLYSRLGEDTDFLKCSIRAELSRGIANGSTWNEIAGRIANGMNNPYRKALNRTILIARTEGHRIQQQSALDAQYRAKEKGADIVKQWDSTLDNRTRPHHRRLDGQIKELDEPFEVDGLKAAAPGQFGRAAEDCNCRCCLLQRARWALDEDELGELKERATYFGLDKTADFEDFKQKYLHLPDNADTMNLKNILNINDCTTVEEVEDLFKSHDDWFNVQTLNGKTYRSIDRLSLKGCDVECAKSIYLTHETLFNDYPQLKGKLNSITTASLNARTYAQCSFGLGHGGITVNTKYYSDINRLRKSIADDEAAGFHPKGLLNEQTAVMHELGHAIDDYLTYTCCSSGMKGWKPKIVSADLRPKVMKACKLKIADIGKEVSGYATKDAQEWFAECFAEYMLSDNPRKVATEFGKQLDEILKGVK